MYKFLYTQNVIIFLIVKVIKNKHIRARITRPYDRNVEVKPMSYMCKKGEKKYAKND